MYINLNDDLLSTNNVLYVEKDRSTPTEVSGAYLKNNNTIIFKSSGNLSIEKLVNLVKYF